MFHSDGAFAACSEVGQTVSSVCLGSWSWLIDRIIARKHKGSEMFYDALRRAGALEVVSGSIDLNQRGGSGNQSQGGAHLLQRSERIARAVYEDCRRRQLGE